MPSKPTVDVNRLPFRHADTWPWRWLYRLYTSSTTLHRLVSRTKWYRGDDGGTPQADGKTACGLSGQFVMPGILSRMGARRCPACCDAVGVPHGRGAPYNSGVREPGCQGPKEKT
jgi:hypothetical protein